MMLPEVIQQQVAELPPERQAQVLDFVLFLHTRPAASALPEFLASRRHRLAMALEKLHRLGTFADIGDPVSWQRDLRQDRPLPGREV